MDDLTLTTESLSKEERKQLRRQRVVLLLGGNDVVSNNKVNEPQQKALCRIGSRRGETQIQDSYARLAQIKTDAISEVSSITLNDSDMIAKSVIQEDQSYLISDDTHERFDTSTLLAISNENISSEEEEAWKTKAQNYEQECKSILQGRKAIIESLRSQLKTKNELFVLSLKNWNAVMNSSSSEIKKQANRLEKMYEKEISLIEIAFDHDRDELIESQMAEIDAMNSLLKIREFERIDQNEKRKREFVKKEEELRRDHSVLYRKFKEELESIIKDLECKIELVQTTIHIKSDKLDFNSQLLSGKGDENGNESVRLKREVAQTQRRLDNSKNNQKAILQSETSRCKKLESECRQLTSHLEELQRKFDHFKAADSKKFASFWSMHHDDIVQLGTKVLSLDKSITENILKWSWNGGRSIDDEFKHYFLVTDKSPSHWDKILNHISDETSEIWSYLEVTMEKYNNILHRRRCKVDSIKNIHDHNRDLRINLKDLKQHSMNNDLIISPAQVIST